MSIITFRRKSTAYTVLFCKINSIKSPTCTFCRFSSFKRSSTVFSLFFIFINGDFFNFIKAAVKIIFSYTAQIHGRFCFFVFCVDFGEGNGSCEHCTCCRDAGHYLFDQRSKDRNISEKKIHREGHIGNVAFKSCTNFRIKLRFINFFAFLFIKIPIF